MTHQVFISVPLVVWDGQNPESAQHIGTITTEQRLPFPPNPYTFIVIESGDDDDAFDFAVEPVMLAYKTSQQIFEVQGTEVYFTSQEDSAGFIQRALANGWAMEDDDDGDGDE